MKNISFLAFLISGILTSSPLFAQKAKVYSAYMVLGTCEAADCTFNATDKDEKILDQFSPEKLQEQISLIGPNSELYLTKDAVLGDTAERNDFWWSAPGQIESDDRKTFTLPEGTVVQAAEPPFAVLRPKDNKEGPYVKTRSGSALWSIEKATNPYYNNKQRAVLQSEYYSEQWYKDVAKFQKKSIETVKQEYKPHRVFILMKVQFQLHNT